MDRATIPECAQMVAGGRGQVVSVSPVQDEVTGERSVQQPVVGQGWRLPAIRTQGHDP